MHHILKHRHWIVMSYIGTSSSPVRDVGTWMSLSLKCASHYARGLIVFDLDKETSIAFVPRQIPERANIDSGLSFLRWKPTESMGIAIRGLELASISVVDDHQDAIVVRGHILGLLQALRNFSCVHF